MNSSERRLPKLLLWLFLMLLGVLLILIERQETIDLKDEQQRTMLTDKVGRRLSGIRRGAGRNVQVQSLLRELRERFAQATGQHFSNGGRLSELGQVLTRERESFKRNRGLPPHRLITLLLAPGRKGATCIDTGEGSIAFDPALPELATSMVTRHNRRTGAGQDWLSRELQFPLCLANNRMPSRNLMICTTFQGERGFFWDRITLGSNGLWLFLGAIVDLDRLPEQYGLEIIAKKQLPPAWGLAFIVPGRPLLTRGICASLPSLSHRLEEIGRGTGKVAPEEWNGRLLLKSALLDGVRGRVVLAALARDEGMARSRSPVDAVFFASLGLAFCFAMYLTVERAVFSRGPRFSIGLVLMGSCLVVALVPTLGMRALFRRTLAENLQNRQIGEARLLHKQMVRLEENVRFAQAMLRSNIDDLTANEALTSQLEREIRHRGPSPTLASWVAKVNTGLYSRIGRRVETAMFIGADGRQKGWTLNLAAATDAMMGLLAPVWRRYLYQFEPGVRPKGGGENPEGSNNAALGQAVQQEMVFETIAAMLGPETMSLLALDPKRISEVRTSYVNVYLSAQMLKLRGMLRYVMFMLWSDWLFIANYLEASILERWNTASWSPSQFMVKARPGLELHWSCNPQLLLGWPPLARLLDLGKYARVNQTDFAPEFPGKPIMELYPSRLMTKALLVGLRPTEPLYRENEYYQWIFRLGTFLAIIIAVFLARHAAHHFLDPLRRLAEAVGQIGRGEYHTRLEANRQDEFGSLAGAFNKMAKGLEEGQLLGRYVSTSVRQAVKDQSLVQQARQGEMREITVLFSSLHGIESDATETDRLFTILEAHLDAFTIATRKHGGEIDKVIGEKVLVVFDHQRFGSAMEAVSASLRVVREAQGILAADSLETAIGVNSGPVIAGILGAPTVRLDFTVIGDTVNLASRLSLLAHTTDGTRVVLSGGTLTLAGDGVRVTKLPFKRVKGKTQEVEAFLLSS